MDHAAIVSSATEPRSSDPAAAASGELDRLSALYGSGLLDEGPQRSLDMLVELAAALLGCPTAMLNLVDHHRQHTRATTGRAFPPLPREAALCDVAIRSPGGLVVPDLAVDPRFPDHPLLADGVRFYAGVPIHAPDDAGAPHAIGALCVTDTVPRSLDADAHARLHRLAQLADVMIAARADARAALGIALEHRRLVDDLARQHRLFAQAERLSGIGWWRVALIDGTVEWSDGVYHLYALAPHVAPDLALALAAYPPPARARMEAVRAHAVETGIGFDVEEDFVTVAGAARRVRCLGEVERTHGRAVALVGVCQDVTDRRMTEAALRRDADTDALTGLMNRAAFDRALAQAARGGAALLVLIDLDGFKAVNDTLGHAAGDEVLREVARRLGSLPVRAACAARIGGDEFALILPAGCIDIVGGLADGLVVPAVLGDVTVTCGASVGYAAILPGEPAREAMHRADLALYADKRAGIGTRRHMA